MENEEISLKNTDETDENGDEVKKVLLEYDNKDEKKSNDITAIQTVLCLAVAVFLFGMNIFYPEICGDIFSRITELSSDKSETFKNPIDTLLKIL